jgi:molecular chaperone GrpE (heat shock protein)
MSDPTNWKVPKWPFWIVNVLLMAFAYYFVSRVPLSIGHWAFVAVCLACVSLGATMAIIPYYLDYKAMGKALEVNALSTVSEKIQDLGLFTEKISAVTDQWHVVHDAVGQSAEKTAVAAKQIADKMGAEVREFAEFMKKMNDNEKAALRLEVDKFRRGEAEWLQTLVRILDHVFALHAAAVRSTQPNVAEQITQFQNVCRGTVRRIGLAAFVGEPNEAFDAERHQLADAKQKPFDGAVIAETVATGYTFQGRLLRPAIVRLRDATTSPAIAAPVEKNKILDDAQDDLALEAD